MLPDGSVCSHISWVFANEHLVEIWERSKFAKTRQMPKLPVERGGERIKRENKRNLEIEGETNIK